MKKNKVLIVLAFLMFLFLMFCVDTSSQGNDKNTPIEYAPSNVTIMEIYGNLPTNVTLFGVRIPNNFTTRDRFRSAMSFHIDHIGRTIITLERLSELDKYLSELLTKKELNSDFKYLFAWESGLDPRANSGSAVGFAQFRRSTAIRYGLKVTSWGDSNGIWDIDERMSPKAFDAGAQYLKDSLDRFINPLLAAASYNTGSSRISHKMNEQDTDEYWNMWMYKETEDFIYYILALKILYEHDCCKLFNKLKPITITQTNISLEKDTLLRNYFIEHNISFELNGRWNRHFREGIIPKKRSEIIYVQQPFSNNK